MLEVLKGGLETSVQDFPGRVGFWEQGFPPSGPFDMWSHRLANALVGNDEGAATLECQFMGPTLRFQRHGVIAVTGADMEPTLDATRIPLWESVAVAAGQVLSLGPARIGARTYIAVAGGIDTPPVLGSRSTFHLAGVGGFAIKAGQVIPVAEADGTPGRSVPEDCRPPITGDREWPIEVVPGPNDDRIDAASHERFLGSPWKLQAKSNRTGMRLEGLRWTFTERATKKRPEHGHEPSNILDHGYPMGAINLCGQTPIILVVDGPSTGASSIPTLSPRQRSGSLPSLAQATRSAFALLASRRRRHCGGESTSCAARTSQAGEAPVTGGGGLSQADSTDLALQSGWRRRRAASAEGLTLQRSTMALVPHR